MFDTSLKISGALLLAAALASCETAGLFPKPGEAYVKEVAVTATPGAVPHGMDARLHATLVGQASRFPQTGTPKRLSVVMTNYHKKNPALALLVGDTNRASGTLTITDLATNAPSKPIALNVFDSSFPQGVAGALQAAADADAAVQTRMIGAASTQALEQFYGSKLVKTYSPGQVPVPAAAPQPVAAETPPAPAAKPNPKPAKPAAPAAQPSM